MFTMTFSYNGRLKMYNMDLNGHRRLKLPLTYDRKKYAITTVIGKCKTYNTDYF